jgi:hypothetical protein
MFQNKCYPYIGKFVKYLDVFFKPLLVALIVSLK